MKTIAPFELTALQVHEALVAANFIPLCSIQRATHWFRDGRHVIVHFVNDATLPLQDNAVKQVLFASFATLESGEILVF